MGIRLAVTGAGLATPLGLTTAATVAALRAGVAGFGEVAGILGAAGEPLIGAAMPGGPAGVWDAERLKPLAVAVCREALASVPADRRRRLRVAALAPEPQRPGAAFRDPAFWRDVAAEASASRPVEVRIIEGGNAAGAAALAGFRDLTDGCGLIVGFDTLLSLPALAYLERGLRLKSADRVRGVIPGEACGAVAVERADAVPAGAALCLVDGAATAEEPVPVASDDPCLGGGLTTAIREALRDAGRAGADVQRVYCDLNGEVYRAHEWMLAQCRTLDGPEVVHPADCVGDVGAASVPLLIAAAAAAWRRGHARWDRVLVFGSSDFGLRGAVCLSRPARA